jgi:UDP:flavonoid glycosyltransferase YjiC (YdhE family)
MNIGIQTWGSNGDIRPFIALADGLKNAGHEVTLVVSSIDNRNYQQTCESLGIHYSHIPAQIDFGNSVRTSGFAVSLMGCGTQRVLSVANNRVLLILAHAKPVS